MDDAAADGMATPLTAPGLGTPATSATAWMPGEPPFAVATSLKKLSWSPVPNWRPKDWLPDGVVPENGEMSRVCTVKTPTPLVLTPSWKAYCCVLAPPSASPDGTLASVSTP